MNTSLTRQPFKKTKTFKVLVLCVYVYSCAQLDPFDSNNYLQIGNEIHAEEQQLEQIMKEKLTKLILSIFQD